VSRRSSTRASWVWHGQSVSLSCFRRTTAVFGKTPASSLRPDTLPEQRAQAQRDSGSFASVCAVTTPAPPFGRPTSKAHSDRARANVHSNTTACEPSCASMLAPLTVTQAPQMKSSTDRICEGAIERFPPSKEALSRPGRACSKKHANDGLSERALRYLAFQYGVSKDTIKRAIWSRGKPQ